MNSGSLDLAKMRLLIRVSIVLASILALILPSVVFADTTIDNTSGLPPTTYGMFTKPNATWGQTVTGPSGETNLSSFSFYMKVPATTKFRGYVYAWDGSKATGSALWEGDTITGPGSDIFHEVTFNTSGVTVTPGTQYILFISNSKVYDESGSDTGRLAVINNATTYTGGGLAYISNGSDSSQWTTTAWNTLPMDFIFKAVFAPEATPTPTPSPTPVPTYGTVNAATSSGSNVSTSLNGATVQFSQVATGGQTTLTTSATGNAAPGGFSVGNPPIYYNISTTAAFSGPIEICIPYDPARFASENGLVLYHYENGNWVNVTISQDQVGNTICGRVSSLSPFIVAGPMPSEAPEPGSLALLASGVIGLGGFTAIRKRLGSSR